MSAAPVRLEPGSAFPDLNLPDHTGRRRRLSEVAGGDPLARLFPGTVVETDLFSEVPPPPGPAIERYAGAPWPGGSFAS